MKIVGRQNREAANNPNLEAKSRVTVRIGPPQIQRIAAGEPPTILIKTIRGVQLAIWRGGRLDWSGLNSTLRPTLATLHLLETDRCPIGGFECNRDLTPISRVFDSTIAPHDLIQSVSR